MANNPENKKTWVIVLVVVLVALAAYAFLTKPDSRTDAQKVGDAVGELPNGLDNAARELEDRTPGERAADAVKDATN